VTHKSEDGLRCLATLTGEHFYRMLAGGLRRLTEQKEFINSLNVFPVPDGDTGNNMVLTVEAALRHTTAPGQSVGDTVGQIAQGALMGARGNSGVILSQIFRGLAQSLQGVERADPQDVAGALETGVKFAYSTVMKPTEGTILTVARAAARYAQRRASEGEDVRSLFEAALTGARKALARTPDLLPVLKRAGVVDAGGQGLVALLEGSLAVLAEDRPSTGWVAPIRPVEGGVRAEALEALGDIPFPYDIEFMLRDAGSAVDQLRASLEGLGDSLMVIPDGILVKVHVHTDNPAAVLDVSLAHGVLMQFDMKNMKEQHAAFTRIAPAGQNAGSPECAELEDIETPETTSRLPAWEEERSSHGIAVVAVAMSEELGRVFRSLGAGAVVPGGQTMNPSTQDILQAIDQVSEQRIILLPNNSNVRLACEQAASICDREVYIVPTATIPQGLSAMMTWSPEKEIDQMRDDMERAAAAVKSGHVTYAVRDTVLDSLQIQQGDVLGLLEGNIVVTGRDRGEVLGNLVKEMIDADGQILTIIYGQDVDDAEAQSIQESLQRDMPQVELEMVAGGQEHYYFIVAAE